MTKQSKSQKATRRKSDPARQTVAELLTTRGVPLTVQVWLERFARGDEYALEKHGTGDDPGVNDTAFLIYDVLETQHDGASVRESAAEARDFVEEWLYTLSTYYGQHVWNNADAALAVLPYFFCGGGSPMEPDGDAAYVLLRTAVERLTTTPERRAFLRQDAADEPEKDEETNRRAAFKLSRVLADPRTPAETRQALESACVEFITNAANVAVDHPALVRRAFLVACDQRPKGRVRRLKRVRRDLLALLDTLPETPEGGE
jgi:hypothetical protein